MTLDVLAFAGTRLSASDRWFGSRTPDELREMKVELAAKFTAREAKTAATDKADEAHCIGADNELCPLFAFPLSAFRATGRGCAGLPAL
jgi:hypothetical protein